MLRWNNYPIMKSDDVAELEAECDRMTQSGVNQPVAKAAAYQNWARRYHEAAAGHHLAGIQTLLGHRNMDARERHQTLYNLHIRKLGLRGAPAAIQSRAREAKDSVGGGFTQHPADKLLTPNR